MTNLDSSTPPDGILWFHRDLRVADHSGLLACLNRGGRWIAIVESPRDSNAPTGRFRLQCEEELRENLSVFGIPLFALRPDEIAPRIEESLRGNPALLVFTSRRYNHRDEAFLQKCTRMLAPNQLCVFDEATLYPEHALPFSLQNLPATFTPFQKRIDAANPEVRTPLPAPASAAPPLTKKTSLDAPVRLNGRNFEFTGGESAAHARLRHYLWDTAAVEHYHETRNGLLAVDDSSKLSPYLAQGCLSARQIHHELLRFEKAHGAGPGTKALRYELQWRDYFKFLALRSGERLLSFGGLRDRELSVISDEELFLRWCEGETGNAFIDANMRELKATGWMSNRGRQNVASFLAKTLRLEWTLGARWFEENLIDLDLETNQGNWMYLAGVGTDPRDRVFNPDLQAQNYDGDGRYRKRWDSLPPQE